MKKILYAILLLSVAFLPACKKDKKTTTTTTTGPSKTGSTLDLIRDSIYLYAKEAYYWNTQLPDYGTFNPRSITGSDDITALTNEVNKLSQYAINPATSLAYEYYKPSPGQAKYSFIDDGTVSTELNGVHGDFGFAPRYAATNDLRVKYVYPGSPADLAGIKRGYQITSINGRTDLTDDSNSSGTTINFIVNAYAYSPTITMTLQKPGGASFNVTLNTANYTVNPVLKDTVYTTANGTKVGYLVFNSFTSDANADPQLDKAFSLFASAGVTNVVIDLRYNGGGYVSTAEYIDNYLVPASKDGSLMYTMYFNSVLTNGQETLLKNQWRKDSSGKDYNYGQFSYAPADNAFLFHKKGSLSINNVFFIVTGSTASASELTINNLRPVLNVKWIGTTSYGKPVGFFDIDINKYQLYVPEFETKNSAGQGGYYTGMTPGSTDYPGVFDNDDVTKDFGDPTERLLAHALNYVQTGAFSVRGPQTQSLNLAAIESINATDVQLDAKKFNGMVFNKKLKKK